MFCIWLYLGVMVFIFLRGKEIGYFFMWELLGLVVRLVYWIKFFGIFLDFFNSLYVICGIFWVEREIFLFFM